MSKSEKFGELVLQLLNERGWHSIPRRELTIRLLDAAIEAGIIETPFSRYEMAIQLSISPVAIDGLLRDRALICKKISAMQIGDLENWAARSNQTTSEDIQRGFIVFEVRNEAEQIQVEAALEKIGIVADYKNNKRLLIIDIKILINKLSKSIDMREKLLSRLITDKKRFKEIRVQLNDNPQQELWNLALEAGKEQIGKRIGEQTTDFFLAAISAIWDTTKSTIRPLTKNNFSTKK
jgi:hypothetical protein